MLNTDGLAKFLVKEGLLAAESIQTFITASTQLKFPLITYLVKNNILSSQKILDCCAKYFNLPVFDLADYNSQLNLLSTELILRYRALPLFKDQHALYIGISDPTNQSVISAISFHTDLSIQSMLVCETKLENILNSISRSNRLSSQLEYALSKIIPIEDKSSNYETSDHDDGPISEFVDKLIHTAIEQNVSDIHIEPYVQHCRIRFRRDGLLCEAATTPPHFAARLIAKLKIMSHLNIAERRLPQDGRLQLQPSSLMDIRINTCPTLFGEKVVLRILDPSKIKLDIDSLGLNDIQKNLFLSRLKQPQGLILVTGPTGSGKTITLYSALHFLNSIEKNISSVEDPVEIEFSGINQVNINPRIGLDFAVVLRSFLRQDPDVIMVGEIRDTQTATIAMQAAQTGHLVLSTLHTNSAIETIVRLQSMGIAAYQFISAVSLIIAQRLVRKLCEHCKLPELSTDGQPFYIPKGCDLCHQGYHGRIGFFEFIPMTEKMAALILSGANTSQLLTVIKQEQWQLLSDAGMELVQRGITSYAELLRVAGRGES